MRKQLTALFLAVSMITGATLSANAAASISQIIPENPVVISGNLSAGQSLIVQNADTSAYENQTVAAVVEEFNDDSTTTTIKEVLDTLEVDTSGNVKTVSNKTVNPTLYEAITPIFDLAIEESDGTVHYNSNGSITATITVEAAKDRNKNDLMLILIDPDTGSVYFITIDELDSETGEITATFPTVGAVVLVEKVPIVVKDPSPELYEDEVTAAIVVEYEEETRDISLVDLLKSLTEKSEAYSYLLDELTNELNEQVEVAEDVYINIAEYTSAMGFADLAIEQGVDENGDDTYGYNMSGTLVAEGYRCITNVDWGRIMQYGDQDFDVEAAEEEAAEEDYSMLVDHESFVAEECVVVQLDATTGELHFYYEPELSFEYDDEEEETELETEIEPETEAEVETEAESETEIVSEEELEDDYEYMKWTVKDKDKATEEHVPNFVVHTEFEAMGPWIFLMPAE